MQEETDVLRPWDQQEGESARAFAAFSVYFTLGPARSLAKTSQNHTKTIPTLKEWSVKHDWVRRAAAYDAHQARLVQREAEAAHALKIAAYRDRAAKIGAAMADVGTAFLVKAGTRVKTVEPETIAVGALPAWLRAASAITRDSLAVEAEALGIHALEGMMTPDDDDSASKD